MSARQDITRRDVARRWGLRGSALAAAAIVLAVAAARLADVTDAADIGTAHKMLDLSAYRQTFDEEFDHLDVSAWGPGTRWIAHTPWHGDFSDARFADPAPGFPFTIDNGVLRIEARKGGDGKWQSGLLSSTDPSGAGFAQRYGYFEMRAKLPPGPGVWPAFWLIANKAPDSSAEIDVMEYYGVNPAAYQATIHVWPKHGRGRNFSEQQTYAVPPGSLSAGFHTYGADVSPEWIRFYFDRKEMGKMKTPPEHRQPMFILVDLALGSGWPIDKTVNPSYMYVDYIRAYERR
jgi:beta-glucanase (GH16 family)